MVILVLFWRFNFSLFWDALERRFRNKTRTFLMFRRFNFFNVHFTGNSRSFRHFWCCFGSPNFGTAVSLHVSSKGLNLCFVFCSLILLALRPPFLSLSGTSRHGFVHPTLVPFPDFIPQSFDALADEFDLEACSHLSSIFHRSFLPANSSSLKGLKQVSRGDSRTFLALQLFVVLGCS